MAKNLTIVPISIRDANAFVLKHHRHHNPVMVHKFSLGCLDFYGFLVGVAIVGNPVARMIDQNKIVEVNRLCTNGTYNACSFLYGACARVAKAMGYTKIITYTLPEEQGYSLKASGWDFIGKAGGGQWSRPSRPRSESRNPQVKWKWEKVLCNDYTVIRRRKIPNNEGRLL